MRILVYSLLLAAFSIHLVQAQSVKENFFEFPVRGKVVLKNLPEYAISLKTAESFNAPFKRLDALKPSEKKSAGAGRHKKAAAPNPQILDMFPAQSPTGTPLDNNLAVSKDGLVFSCANTTVRVLDSTGKFLFSRSLSAIANELGTLNRTFDPHTIYDPVRDRFILVFLNGSDHNNTQVIIGFSETNDPREAWNFYSIPGNTTQNEWWSDYPFIGISDDALFISVLLWQDDESGWDTDAIDENIWKINLEDGFAGNTLRTQQFHELQYGGKQLWNSRPMSGALENYGGDFYLLTNRPKDLQNDTFFLIRVEAGWDSANTGIEVIPIVSDQAYGLQPNVTQKGGRRLRTNYCDIQNGYYFNGNIYFCSNSIDPTTGRPGVYVGKIQDVKGSRTCTGKIFGVDSLDLNYPSMAYSGAGWPDESAVVMCLHNSENSYPGTSVFSMGRNGEFSDLVRVKEGEGMMKVLLGVDSLERWGDYTGIQRDYSHTGHVWIAGSYGLFSGASQTWIARIGNSDPQLGINDQSYQKGFIYPNPSKHFNLVFSTEKAQRIDVQLMDIKGQEVFHQSQYLIAGEQHLGIEPGIHKGIYLIIVKDAAGNILLNEKLQVE